MVRRPCLAVALFAAAALGVAALSPPPAASGQDKKAAKQDLKQDLLKAEKQVAALQAEIREGKALVAALQADVRDGKALVAALQAEVKKGKAGDAADARTVQSLTAQLAAVRGARYVHTSVWKKKADTTDADVRAFLDDVPAVLGAVKAVRVAWAGRPAVTSADADLVLVLAFDDAAAFEKHKADPQAKTFHDRYDGKFESPRAVEFAVR